MMEPDLPGMGAVMDIEESGLDFMVTGPRILPEPERARVFGSVMVKAGLYVCIRATVNAGYVVCPCLSQKDTN